MKTKRRMMCPSCKYWNRITVEKFLSVQLNSELSAERKVVNCLPLKTEKWSKCGAVIAKEKELIRIVPSTA
jgi:hypothetical protein